jgi:aminoglycoside 6'-N-acetyltransferase I
MLQNKESYVRVRLIEPDDLKEWLRMRMALWPDCPADKHQREMGDIRANLSDTPVFVAVRDEGGLSGFLEASLRSQADGCEHSPVGYIEGWYTDPDVRQTGVGAVLMQMAEAWAALRGCQEMASDCLIDNRLSYSAHLALGFQEAERLVHFRKSLLERAPKKPKKA